MKLNVPAAVGVPLIVPSPLNARPGRQIPPASDHVYGCVPPVAASESEYATPRRRGWAVSVVIVKGATTRPVKPFDAGDVVRIAHFDVDAVFAGTWSVSP